MKKIISQSLFPSVMIFSLFVNLFSPFLVVYSVNAQELSTSELSSSSEVSVSSSSSVSSSETMSSVETSSSTTSSVVSTPPVVMEEPKVEVSEVVKVEPDLISTISNSLYSIAPFLFTNKPDYAPNEKVVISGTGFAPSTEYTVVVSSNDSPAVTHTDKFTTDSTGKFTYEYQLDGNYRPNYLVQIKDESGSVLSTQTFTDSRTINSVTLNGGSSVTVTAGASIAVVVNATTTSNDDWSSTSWGISTSPANNICDTSGNHTNSGTYSETFNITAPNTLGTYNAYFKIHNDNSCGSSGESSYITLTNSVIVVAPDLTVTKTNNVSGTIVNGNSFNWVLTITNSGAATATFENNDVTLYDQLPTSGATYGSVTSVNGSGTTGTNNCSISSNTLTCTSSGNPNKLTIPVGGTVTITIPVTTTAEGTLTNPRNSGTCRVDYDTNISESDENNNNCVANTVTVTSNAVPNPLLSQACGLDIALVIDNSGSIDSGELTQMKNAMTAFTSALSGTPTQFSVTKFATTGSVVQAFTSNIANVNSAINGIPINEGSTNWQDGLVKTNSTLPNRANPNLVIFASDGNPNRTGVSGTTVAESIAVADAVVVANLIKSGGTRIIALGIGNGLDVDNLKAISGPTVGTNLSADVITSDFATLASTLASFASQTCGGTITVSKYLDNVNTPAGAGWQFGVNGQTYTTDGTGKTEAITVPAGTYTVSETGILQGYAFGSAVCRDQAGNIRGSNSVVPPGVASVNVGNTDIITCTFVNTTLPRTGSIKIEKDVVPNDASAWDFTVSGVGGNYTHDDLNDGQTYIFSNVPEGSYNITEITDPNYTTQVTCGGVGPLNQNGFLGTVVAGQELYCKFTNTKKGRIIVDKVTYPSGDPQSFTFVANGSGYSGFSLTDLTTPNSQLILPGLYTVSEGGRQGWINDGGVCDMGETPASIDVGPGETVTCTFTNTKKGHIIVDKVTNPVGDPQSFSFTPTGSGYNGFALTDLETPNNQEVVPGSYTISEGGRQDWTSDGGVCDMGETPASIDVGPGETVTCIFTNTKKSTLTVNKACWPVNDSGKFNLLIDGQVKKANASCGESTGPIVMTIGEHVMSENQGTATLLSEYQASILSGTGCVDDHGTYKTTLAAGENRVCTITNTKNARIIVHKETYPDGDDQVFQLTSNYLTHISLKDGESNNTGYTIAPMQYWNVSELPTTGWTNTSSTCDNQDPVNLIFPAPGQTINCTFTNVKDPFITIEGTATNEVNNEHTFTVTVGQNGSDGFTPLNGLHPTVTILPVGFTLVSDNCAVIGTVNGLCTVVINSSNASIFAGSVNASVVIDGHTFNMSSVVSAVKTYVDAKIVLTPETAENPVYAPHTVTATVYVNPGDGEGLASNELVSFDLENNTAGATFVGDVNTCTTNINGQCSIQINSLAPGYTNIHGMVSPVVGGLTLTRVTDGQFGSSEDAYKEYVAGRIIIEKQTYPDGSNQEFTFNADYSENFILRDGWTGDSGYLAPGTYSVSETLPEGWDLTDIYCTSNYVVDDRFLLNNVVEIVNGTYISIEAGETKTCVFTNTQKGHLIVQKTTDPVGDPTEFEINIEKSIILDVAVPTVMETSDTVSDLNDMDYEVYPGTYSVTETVPEGWVKTGEENCQDVVVDPGETVYCILSNTKMGSITVVKDATKNDLQDFTFSGTFGAFTLDDDLNVVGGDNTNLDRKTFSDLMPGSFTFTENALSDLLWGLKSVSCVDQDNQVYNNVTSLINGITVNLTGGKNLTCTFVNTKGEVLGVTDPGTVLAVTGEQMSIALGLLAISLSLSLGLFITKLNKKKENSF